jgi:outer membrane lipoprotein-sorting protein
MSRRAASHLLLILLVVLFYPAPKIASALESLPTAKEIIFGAEKKFASIEDYTCTADAHYRKGDRTEDKVFRVFFKKPELVRLDVLKGDGEGGAAVLTKDGGVKAHGGGWLSWLVLPFGLDNPLVTTIRGHTLRQSHFGYIIQMMKETLASNEASVAAESFDGAPSYVLKTSYIDAGGVARKEVAVIDRASLLVRKVQEYEGSAEVVSVTYYDIRTDQGLKDRLFDM